MINRWANAERTIQRNSSSAEARARSLDAPSSRDTYRGYAVSCCFFRSSGHDFVRNRKSFVPISHIAERPMYTPHARPIRSLVRISRSRGMYVRRVQCRAGMRVHVRDRVSLMLHMILYIYMYVHPHPHTHIYI